MARGLLSAAAAAALLAGAVAAPSCPCSPASLCEPVAAVYPRELLAFHVAGSNFSAYNWSAITTVAAFRTPEPTLVCAAHAAGARLVLGVDFDTTQLGNATAEDAWIAATLEDMAAAFADGVNIDIEGYRGPPAPLVALTARLKAAVRGAIPMPPGAAQVSFDTSIYPLSPGIAASYDLRALAEIVDFLVPMGYDMDWASTLARANAPAPLVEAGVTGYISSAPAGLGIPPWKVVLGVPWYGYSFPCASPPATSPPPASGRCVSAPGFSASWSKCFGAVATDLLPTAVGGRQWDAASSSPYLNNRVQNASSGETMWYQTWYDDEESLGVKATAAAAAAGIRGVAMWHAGCLMPAGGAPLPPGVEAGMWSALADSFPKAAASAADDGAAGSGQA